MVSLDLRDDERDALMVSIRERFIGRREYRYKALIGQASLHGKTSEAFEKARLFEIAINPVMTVKSARGVGRGRHRRAHREAHRRELDRMLRDISVRGEVLHIPGSTFTRVIAAESIKAGAPVAMRSGAVVRANVNVDENGRATVSIVKPFTGGSTASIGVASEPSR